MVAPPAHFHPQASSGSIVWVPSQQFLEHIHRFGKVALLRVFLSHPEHCRMRVFGYANRFLKDLPGTLSAFGLTAEIIFEQLKMPRAEIGLHISRFFAFFLKFLQQIFILLVPARNVTERQRQPATLLPWPVIPLIDEAAQGAAVIADQRPIAICPLNEFLRASCSGNNARMSKHTPAASHGPGSSSSMRRRSASSIIF